jgi:copper chaperone NosL
MPSRDRPQHDTRRALKGLSLAVLVLATAACTPRPEPIVYGEDVCAHCRMVIVDERYGAELVTTKGRVLTFDSIECLADYVSAQDASDVHSLWVTSYTAPGELISIEDALFLHSPELNSPMGANLTAFRASETTPTAVVDEYGGEILDWSGVLDLVATRPPGRGHMHNAPAS